MKTLTEKYRGVLSESFSKKQFVRDAKIAHPTLITSLNGFNDTVKILKNKGFISEKQELPKQYGKYEIEGIKSEDKFSIEAIERGIDAELEAAGLMSQDSISKEDYGKAKEKALSNLEKDQNHYLNLMAGESESVDKHDKMVPADGKNNVDTFNGMKNAELKESKSELAKLLKEGKLEDLANRLGVPVEKLKGAADKIKDMERQSAEKDALKLAKMKEVIDEEEDIEEVQGHAIDEHEHTFFSLIFNQKYDDILGDYLASEQYKDDERELQDETGQPNVFDAAYMDHWEHYIKEFEANNYDKLDEKEGKDHDNDGDVDGDDYLAAKDKAIKKAMGKDEMMREGIKAIVSKVLEEQVVNEAATHELAKMADSYGDFEGFKQSIIQLEHIVTDIEAYYDKTRSKIQKIYDSIDDIRNEEGLKVGAFLAPAIESAFNKDLRPVIRSGFTKGLETPKVRVIKKGSPTPMDAPIDEIPKKTVFSVNE